MVAVASILFLTFNEKLGKYVLYCLACDKTVGFYDTEKEYREAIQKHIEKYHTIKVLPIKTSQKEGQK
jgi:hypothetical protein